MSARSAMRLVLVALAGTLALPLVVSVLALRGPASVSRADDEPTATATNTPTLTNTNTPTKTNTPYYYGTRFPTYIPTPIPTATPCPGDVHCVGLPDLVVGSIQQEWQGGNGCLVSFNQGARVSVSNIGVADAGPFVVDLDTEWGGQHLSVDAGLAAHEGTSLWFPSSGGGLLAIVDATLMVTESDENNNTRFGFWYTATPPPTCSPTPRATLTPTPMPTDTYTPMPTFTPTPTATWTPTITPSPTMCPGDADCDSVPDNVDNCPNVSNPDQLNTDAKPIDNGPDVPGYDYTVPNSDILGDVCDPDIDNDYMLNTGTNALLGLPGEDVGCGSLPTNPKLMDTDGDTVIDGAECLLGSDPRNPLSKPSAVPPNDSDGDGLPDNIEILIGSDPHKVDSDGDGILDGVEVKGWGTSPILKDSNFNSCPDNVEIADVNGDYWVNIVDVRIAAQAAGHIIGYNADLDLNKDGLLNIVDLRMTAQQMGKSCG
jgi:hypothetical protein